METKITVEFTRMNGMYSAVDVKVVLQDKIVRSVNSFPGPNLFIFDEIQHYDTTTILLPRTSI